MRYLASRAIPADEQLPCRSLIGQSAQGRKADWVSDAARARPRYRGARLGAYCIR